MPMFYMMVGLPGSGKSFTPKASLTPSSTPAMRSVPKFLVTRTTKPNRTWFSKPFTKGFCQDLVDGKDVVYDATNINYKRRIGFLDRVRSAPQT